MDLRRRTTHVLAAAGALLIVGGLSLSGGVAVAVPGPAADDNDQATTSSSQPKSSKQKKKSTSTTETTDTTGSTRPSRSPRSTATTATTATTTTTATTGTTRPPASTGTTRPPTTATTAPPTTATTAARAETAPQPVEPSTDPSDDPSAPEPGDETTAPDSPSGNRPTARSGSGLPPGVYPVGPGARSNRSTPAATTAPAPLTTTDPGPPATAAPAETQPTREGTVSEGGVSDPVTDSLLDPGVSGTELERGESPAPARRSQQLGQTGDGTRRLVLVGGAALLLGALVVAFAGRDRPPVQVAGVPVGPAVRRPRPRRELDGWEDGVPLAPAKRELARQRLGISACGAPDDEPGA